MQTIFRHLKSHNYLIHLQFRYTRILQHGILGIFKRVIKKIVSLLLAIILLPCSLLMYFYGVKRLCFFTERIGHLAIEPDTLLKAEHLGLIKSKRWFVLAPKNRLANQHLMQYWKKYFLVYQDRLSCFLLNCISLWPFMRYDVTHFINSDQDSQFAYVVNKKWEAKPALLSLTEADKTWGSAQLIKLGVPSDAWFVCIHVREGGFSPVDEALHSYRNSNIENLIPAIQEITRRGGWVIRLGDPTMVPLIAMPQLIDYAHHPLRSERLDIILCAKARFILGNTSGIFLVGSIFGVPSALANMIPIAALGYTATDISIPKLFWLKNEKRYMTFKEVMESPIANYRYSSLYEKIDNMVVEENSPEDILLLVKEMFDRLDGKFIENGVDHKRHQQYMALFKPHHYAYGSCSRVSTGFLQAHIDLLKD